MARSLAALIFASQLVHRAAATCSASWCSSSDGFLGTDCWAGGTHLYGDGCSCSNGHARLTGATTPYMGRTYRGYTCCTAGATTGEQCGLYTGCTDPAACTSTSQSIAHGGKARAFTVVTPPGLALGASAAGLLIGVHGLTQSAQWACQAMAQPYVQQLNMIAVCPQGLRAWGAAVGATGWNAEVAPGYGADDDVGFIRAARDWVLARYAVAGDLAYAIGFSFGGEMTYRLMCEASDVISGFGVVGAAGPYTANTNAAAAGSYAASWAQSCSPATPRPLWQSMGTSDYFYQAAATETSWRTYAETVMQCAPSSLRSVRRTSGGEVLINRSTYQVKAFYLSSETVLPIK
jgi:poly(3-hydroxybutyrate) depolymerase